MLTPARHRALVVALVLAGTTVAPAAARAQAQDAASAPRLLRIAAIASGDTSRALHDGLRLGAEEAARSAALFGWTVELSVAEAFPGGELSEALGGASAGAHAIIVGGSEALCAHARARAHRVTQPVLTVACASDAIRGVACGRAMFHVSPSASMRAGALAMAASPRTRVVEWDSTLERFGAGQVNDRFRARFGRGAGEEAWAAWLAVKALMEAAIRAGSTDPERLSARLAASTFDGHKGLPLTFREWDGQLRQPLYLVSSSRGTASLPQEVPVRTPGVQARELLDRLGAGPSDATLPAATPRPFAEDGSADERCPPELPQ